MQNEKLKQDINSKIVILLASQYIKTKKAMTNTLISGLILSFLFLGLSSSIDHDGFWWAIYTTILSFIILAFVLFIQKQYEKIKTENIITCEVCEEIFVVLKEVQIDDLPYSPCPYCKHKNAL